MRSFFSNKGTAIEYRTFGACKYGYMRIGENMIKEKNCVLEIKRHGRYDDMYLTLDDGTYFQVKLAFFNNKLLYKIKKVVQ